MRGQMSKEIVERALRKGSSLGQEGGRKRSGRIFGSSTHESSVMIDPNVQMWSKDRRDGSPKRHQRFMIVSKGDTKDTFKVTVSMAVVGNKRKIYKKKEKE